jgi:aspartate--ammonia ligase
MKTNKKLHDDLLERERAISIVKSAFENELKESLSLTKVSAPIAVLEETGLNDDLNGIERPVHFPIKALNERKAVVVHSLAKWKRLRLAQLHISEERGIITDMKALRPDEELTALHSIYVDQWDWEKVMPADRRDLPYLKETVRKVYDAILTAEYSISEMYPELEAILPSDIHFVHSEELEEMYPDKSPKERENLICKEHGSVFIIGIGGELSNGKSHDGRAPDYDDWSTPTSEKNKGLNGDILLWNPVLESAFEVSSMGIRVDKSALERQLKICGAEGRKSLYFHQKLLKNELPQTIGGGIGQSRLAMFLLKKQHISEVQIGIWPEGLEQDLIGKGTQIL